MLTIERSTAETQERGSPTLGDRCRYSSRDVVKLVGCLLVATSMALILVAPRLMSDRLRVSAEVGAGLLWLVSVVAFIGLLAFDATR